MRALLLVTALMAGCDGGDKDTATEDGLACTEVIEEMSIEEESPLGFAGRAITTLVAGEDVSLLTWADGTTTNVSVKVSYADGDIRYIDREIAEGGAEIALDSGGELCPDSLELDVTVRFETEDGLMDEEWPTPLWAYAPDEAFFLASFDPLDMVGTYDILPAVTSTDYDELSATASGTVNLSGSTGEVSGQASGEDECADGDECTAWAERIEIGSWIPVSN